MTNPLLPVIVRTQIFVAMRREQLRNRLTDRGAGLVEYGALIVLAIAILTAIYQTGIIDTVNKNTKQALDDLFNREFRGD
ncbi:hypothetical protein CDO52_21490 [Nocardiopsis gilva YIM 90087]|uniref:Uncharacterized protein n=1 Tax=Nocardiopsis gilva YIM 90087 TaxID=1235441 RepID=A0A223SAF1_9ACTN|nr:hypothetical protein [Nocardiopsis gilva]ASU85026.1 hypothetical protein CDO52_21490 [Nocardiopsis gilva YIM 90087]